MPPVATMPYILRIDLTTLRSTPPTSDRKVGGVERRKDEKKEERGRGVTTDQSDPQVHILDIHLFTYSDSCSLA